MNRFIVSLILMLVGSCMASSQLGKRISDEKGRQAINNFLRKIQSAQTGQIISIDDDPVVQAFPFDRFYVLSFRRYPVAHALPESLTYNNLLVVHADEKVEFIRDPSALEAFFRSQLRPVTAELQARHSVKAWLRLSQEFQQDGFFQFSTPESGLLVVSERGGMRASGNAEVGSDYGNSGEIFISLSFNAAGKLTDVKERANVMAGRRPNF